MSLRLRSNQHFKLAGLLSAGLYVIVVSFVILSDEIFTQLDYQTLDWFHRLAVEHGRGPQDSPHIVYLTITDSTYKAFNSNTLDRARLVPVNMALAALDVEAVAYDIIFARPSNPRSDQEFSKSLRALGSAYLPIGLGISNDKTDFRWEEGMAYERLRSRHLARIRHRF